MDIKSITDFKANDNAPQTQEKTHRITLQGYQIFTGSLDGCIYRLKSEFGNISVMTLIMAGYCIEKIPTQNAA